MRQIALERPGHFIASDGPTPSPEQLHSSGTLTYDRELTLRASRNALPGTFRDIVALIEAGRIDTAPWITHRFDLADTPRRFPEVAADPAVIKAVISVSV